MKKFLTAIVAICMTLAMAPAAFADHSDSGDFFPDSEGEKWTAASETYCMEDDFPNNLGAPAYSNARVSTSWAINEVESDTQVSTNFSLQSGECASNYPGVSYLSDTSPCQTIQAAFGTSINSRISYEDLPEGTAARGVPCDLNNNNIVDFFWIVINKTEPGWDLHFDTFSIPALGENDYSGLLMHEFIHGLGWGSAHFSSGGSACTQTVGGYNTMCPNADVGTLHDSNSNGTWWKTLETHDIGAINEVY